MLIWLDRRYRLGHGRVAALYVMLYTAGRGWIEYLRIDNVQMDDVLGLRLNVWTSIVLFVLAAAFFALVGAPAPGARGGRAHPAREDDDEDERRARGRARARRGGDAPRSARAAGPTA